jgi:hypothetical protein
MQFCPSYRNTISVASVFPVGSKDKRFPRPGGVPQSVALSCQGVLLAPSPGGEVESSAETAPHNDDAHLLPGGGLTEERQMATTQCPACGLTVPYYCCEGLVCPACGYDESQETPAAHADPSGSATAESHPARPAVEPLPANLPPR